MQAVKDTPAKNQYNTAIVRIKEVRRPLSRETIGYRLQACVPNLDAKRMLPVQKRGEIVGFRPTSEPVPSFANKYLIAESSDFTQIGEREWKRFMEKLEWQGYHHIEILANGKED